MNFTRQNISFFQKKGDDKKFHFLSRFLPENEEFNGSLEKEYNILFKTKGNFLILYKATTNRNDIPFTERTSEEILTKKGKKYYAVPFVGYPIEYCVATREENKDDEETNKYLAPCGNEHNKNADHLRIVIGKKRPYDYEEKRDFFPSDYFKGKWIVARGLIETHNREKEVSPATADLIEFEQGSKSLNLIDASGSVEDRHRSYLNFIPVAWLNYEMDIDGGIFNQFRERVPEGEVATLSPYLNINTQSYINSGHEIIDFLISEDYFSITFSAITKIQVREQNVTIPKALKIKHKMAFLRAEHIDEKYFTPRRWFQDDHERYFGTLWTMPQYVEKREDISKEAKLALRRIIHFDTKNPKSGVIKWYFSENSTKETVYRDIVREAIQIYDQAIQRITGGKIQVELDEVEEKDLGDLRYNVINLVNTEELGGRGGLLGFSPSYVNPDTGQIIGGTANIFLQNVLEDSDEQVRHFIRHEIFQKQPDQVLKGDGYAVNSYILSQIQEKCLPGQSETDESSKTSFKKFITEHNKRASEDEIQPTEVLEDKDIIFKCSEAISKDYILSLTLHEVGHNFGLSHNFEASVDEKNYWTSIDEIRDIFPNANLEEYSDKKMPKTSSVMDYLPPLEALPLTVLGKYDLAALKFVYMNQFEHFDLNTDGSLRLVSKELDFPEDPAQQKQISQQFDREILTAYLHCPDDLARRRGIKNQGENFFCQRFDYGSNPLETVNYHFEKVKYVFRSLRYRYDVDRGTGFGGLFTSSFIKIAEFYSRWVALRNQYLKSTQQQQIAIDYMIGNDERAEDYKKTIQEGLDINENYNKHHQIRSLFHRFMTDFIFLETMKCEVCELEENSKDQCKVGSPNHLIDLEIIREALLPIHKEDSFVRNCFSTNVQTFLQQKGLKLLSQIGVENFKSYYSEEKHNRHGWDVYSLSGFLKSFVGSQDRIELLPEDPDLYEEFREKLEDHILKDDLSKDDREHITKVYGTIKTKILKEESEDDEEKNKEIVKYNDDHFRPFKFFTGTENSLSFYNLVIRPVSNDNMEVKDIEIPFLTEKYAEYLEHCRLLKEDQGYLTEFQKADADGLYGLHGGHISCHEQEMSLIDFQRYLIGLPTSIDNTKEKDPSFIIPFQPGNFSSRMIVKYNGNLREINRLDDIEKQLKAQEEELTFLQKINRQNRKEHNEALLETICTNRNYKKGC